MEHLYPVIIAGGTGTRLWPVSRADDPKQVKPFVGDQTLLQKTYERVKQIVPDDNVWVETNERYGDMIKEQLQDLPDENYIFEPDKRNTAPAVGLAAAVLNKKDPDSIMLNVWSDHYFKKEGEYLNKVKQAAKILEEYPDYLIDIVAEPTYPATGYGYLEVDEEAKNEQGLELYFAEQFVEKPDLATAEKYMKSGNFYWNPAIFLWKTETLLNLFEKHQPEMYEKLMTLQEAYGTDEWQEKLEEIYPTFENISIDYAIFEKTEKILMLPAELGWKDVGSWQAIYDILKEGEDETVATGDQVIAVDSEDTLVYGGDGDRVVGLVGVDDIVVVDTEDALLVMKKSKDQDIKKLIEKVREEGLEDYL